MTNEVTRDASEIAIIIVAAGRGERAGAPMEGPKQYRRIGGMTVFARTLRLFLGWPSCGRIVAVIHPDDETLFEAVRGEIPAAEITVVFGGMTRQESVLKGLEALASDPPSTVMIHDAVRPFATHDLLDRVANALEAGQPAVLPTLEIVDTLKRGDPAGLVIRTEPRAGLFGAQTPQAFTYPAILAAHRAAARETGTSFTDDASIAEWASLPVQMVSGEAENIKLTLKRDIDMARERLAGETKLPDVRTGNGYDVHQLEPGDGVTLCGIVLPHDQRLKGHSDADVALHALTDALLATCGAGDIGDHFPPSDPQWKGAASHIFVEHAASIVRAAGGTIMNADITLIAEAPKIGPRRQEMRENLARMLGITLDRCSVKATTNETIGFIGRREGIAAIATATVVYSGENG